MRAGRASVIVRLSGVALAVAGTTASAQQIELPQIVVNAPSPIRTQTPTDAAPGGLVVVPDTFAPVTVVTGQEIDRSPGHTLGDLLATRPGITASTFAPGAASRPIIRGLDNYRVRIQENGIGSHDVSEIGEDHGVPIDPLAAQQVEVLRGPATLRWGSQAIGGVVNVTNNRIPEAVPRNVYSLETKASVSSVDNGIEGSTLFDIGKGNFAFHADAYGRSADSYGIPGYPYLFPGTPAPVVNGRQPNSAMRSSGQAVGGSYLFEGGFVGVSVSQFDSLYRVPGLESTETNTRIDMKQTKVTSKGEYRPSSSAIDSVRFWFGASDYKHDELANEGGFDGVQQTFTNKELEGRVEVQLMPFDLRWATLTTAIGVQAGHQRLAAPGVEGGLFDPNRTRSIAGFAFNEFRFSDTVRMQAAGRIEQINVDGAAPDFPSGYLPTGLDPVSTARNSNFTPMSGSIGLLKDLPYGLTASLTGQYVERAPRAPELFSRGVHEATGTFDIGDPNLGIESAKTLEAGIRRAKGQLRFDASVYHTIYSGFIFRRLTGATCDEDFASCIAGPGGELNQAVYSQRDATFTGAEIAAQLDVAPIGNGLFGIDGQYDIVRARFADGTNVPRIPPQRVGGGVWWRSAEWFARIGVLHAFAQNNIAANETPTAGYDLVKAEISHTRKLQGQAFREITVGVIGDNLLDADMRNHVSFRKDEVLLPGRNVRAYAKLTF